MKWSADHLCSFCDKLFFMYSDLYIFRTMKKHVVLDGLKLEPGNAEIESALW